MNRIILTTIVLAAIVVVGLVAQALDANPTGYYLPKGYKVKAIVHVPGSPFWPGDIVGDIVGISCDQYQVLAVGIGYKTWSGEADSGIRVYWKEGGTEREVAREYRLPEGEHTVEIVYGYDGYIYFSVDGKYLYGFAATKDKYVIVANGAQISQPEPLPSPTTTGPTGTGYSPKSVNELQVQYIAFLLLGIGAIALITIIMTAKVRP